MAAAGIMRDLKKHRDYLKPGARRRRKRMLAERRRQRATARAAKEGKT